MGVAGRPKAQLRKLQEKLATAGIDPATLEPEPTPPPPPPPRRAAPPPQQHAEETGEVESLRARTRTRAHASTREPSAARTMPIGASTRQTIDSRTSDDLESLAAQLRPNLIARVERVRPTWAAGWIEDYPIDDDNLSELLEYVRDEHGGSNYKITILAVDGTALYSSKIAIAGMPRKRGREVPRSRWDGSDDDEPRARIREAEAPQTNGGRRERGELTELVQALASFGGNNGRDHVLEAVREMTDRTQKQTTELIRAIVETRSQERQSGGLTGQLREVLQATETIRELREALTDDQPPPRAEDERGGSSRMIEALATDLLRQGMANDAGRQRPTTPQSGGMPPPGMRARPVMRRRPPPPPQGNA